MARKIITQIESEKRRQRERGREKSGEAFREKSNGIQNEVKKKIRKDRLMIASRISNIRKKLKREKLCHSIL